MKVRFSGQTEIHVELDGFVFERHREHPAGGKEIGCFSNREGICALHVSDDFRITRQFRAADKQDVTAANLLIVANPPHRDAAAVRRGITGHFGKRRAKTEVSENTDDERGIRGRERTIGPVDETGKRGEECRFAAVFAGDGVLRRNAKRRTDGKESQQDDRDAVPLREARTAGRHITRATMRSLCDEQKRHKNSEESGANGWPLPLPAWREKSNGSRAFCSQRSVAARKLFQLRIGGRFQDRIGTSRRTRSRVRRESKQKRESQLELSNARHQILLRICILSFASVICLTLGNTFDFVPLLPNEFSTTEITTARYTLPDFELHGPLYCWF